MRMTYHRFFLAIACVVCVASQALAATSTKSSKSSVKHVKASKTPEATNAAIDADDAEPDTKNAQPTEYNCELGNKLTVYRNADDDQHIALSWKKRIHRLQRVETTTGADRFENRKQGLLWIGIPAKSILLDTKKGQQLANECKNAAQITAELAVH